jgi:hypothetical protein
MLSKEEGISLDRKIAVEIMGLKVVEDPVNYRGYAIDEAGSGGGDLPHFCTKIEQAMKVWDCLRNQGQRWLLNVDDAGFHLRHVACITHHGDVQEKDYRVDRPLGTAKKVEDLPRVICEAALREVEWAHKEWVKRGVESEREDPGPSTIGRKQ